MKEPKAVSLSQGEMNPETKNEPIPEAFTKYGIKFVTREEYPKEILEVTKDNAKEIVLKYKPEIQWVTSVLRNQHGFAISLPQIGIPYNFAVLNTNDPGHIGQVSLICNLKYEIKDNNTRRSHESDYSIKNGSIYHSINRFTKIIAEWDSCELDKSSGDLILKHRTQALKIKKNPRTTPASVIFQNAADHMKPEYFTYMEYKLSRYKASNKRAIDYVEGKITETSGETTNGEN